MDTRGFVVLAALVAAALPRIDAAAATPMSYRASFAPATRTLEVEACAPGPAAVQRFEAVDRRASGFLLASARSSGATLVRERGTLVARDWRAHECLVYRVDL